MKVFVTGHRGYIGPHVVELLKKKGHFVTGCDIDLFGESQIAPPALPDTTIAKDIRHLDLSDLRGYDCVMHLAAISNDPMGNIDKEITYGINIEGSLHLARVAKEAGVRQFVFSSSCSIYGKGETNDLSETAGLSPLTPYAVSKIETENELSKLADSNFSPVCLRNATAYGFSPMFRIDLVVNNFMACAIAKREVRVMSDGEPWRPLIHCRDIAHAFLQVFHAGPDYTHNMAINVGSNTENYQVKEVAAKVAEMIPGTEIVFTGETGVDPRDYRVNFDLYQSLFPKFKFEYTLESGMRDLLAHLTRINFSLADYNDERFVRLKLLQRKLQTSVIS